MESGQLQVGQHLRLMHFHQSLDRFQLADDQIINDQVDAISTFYRHTFIKDRQGDLTCDLHPAFDQFISQTGFIGGFEKSRAQVTVHFDSGADDPAAQAITHLCVLCALCGSTCLHSRQTFSRTRAPRMPVGRNTSTRISTPKTTVLLHWPPFGTQPSITERTRPITRPSSTAPGRLPMPPSTAAVKASRPLR